MAKLIINVGEEANDGTGDPIRTAMTKSNTNFTELYESVADLEGGGTGYGNVEVSAHLNVSTAEDDQVLSWDGVDYAWVDAGAGSSYSNADAVAAVVASDLDMAGNKVLFGNVYPGVSDLPDASAYHGMFAHVHATGGAYFAHSGAWVELQNAGGGGLQTRQSPSTTTASLANNASGNIDIVGYKTYALLSIITNKAAWVRIYATTAARAADASRSQSTDPAPDAGVIAEVITAGAETVLVSPGVIGYNMESTPTTSVPCAVTNLSGSTGTVFVSLNLLQLEA